MAKPHSDNTSLLTINDLCNLTQSSRTLYDVKLHKSFMVSKLVLSE